MNKKLITIIMIICMISLIVTGCENNIVEKSIDQAKRQIESKEYDKALISLQTALDEEKESKEASELFSIVNNYQKAKELAIDGNYEEAKKVIDKIDSKYMNYAIRDDVELLKQQIKDRIKESELVNDNLSKLLILIDEKNYEDSNILVEEIYKSVLNQEQKNKLDVLKARIESELYEIEEQAKVIEESKLEQTETEVEESTFTKRRAIEFLCESNSFYKEFDIIDDSGQYYFGKGENKVISISLWECEYNSSNGLRYYSYSLDDLEMIEQGGTGTIEHGYIYENGTIEY